MDAPRILIVKTSSMGDVVHALPVVADIRQAVPQAAVDWVVEEGFAAIPRMHPELHRVIPVALRRWRRAPLRAATWREVASARSQLAERPYGAVIDLQGLVKSAWLVRWARGPSYGPDRASAREALAARFYDHPLPMDRRAHAIERCRRLAAAALGYAPAGAPRFGLRPPRPSGDAAAWLEQPFAVLLTNASRASKQWPGECWRALEARLAAQGLRSLLVWGTDEEASATRERAHGMRNAWVAPRRVPVDVIAGVLSAAQVVVGLDTGLTHLAAAVGAPTVGIFCDYDPALVGVTGAAPSVSLGGVDRAPGADEVSDAALKLLGARTS